jgi:hypothetical protein
MSQPENAWAIAEELMSQNMLDVPIHVAAPVIAKVLASRAPDKENEEAMSDQEPLTSEQVLAEVDEYCATKGNPLLAPVMRQAFEKDKRMPHAVLVSLNLEPVMMWRRKS